MKVIFTGLESQGKSLLLARLALILGHRNAYYRKRHGFVRPIHSNLRFSAWYENKYKDFIHYWSDVRELLKLKGCDILHDEISSDFSSQRKEPLPRSVNRWLRQGAKQGVEYYATAQEYHDVSLDFRRRVFKAFKVSKIVGSRRGGCNQPPISKIWGLCRVRQLKINPYNELQPEFHFSLPPFDCVFITKALCSVFDTHQFILDSDSLPLEHSERVCPTCNFKRVYHS